MDTESGRVYRTEEEIEEAKARGEQIVMVSERVADALEIGMEALNRAERRAQRFPKNAHRHD